MKKDENAEILAVDEDIPEISGSSVNRGLLEE